nr:hypothetical protein [Tanacetum cinerariifolium]
MLAVQTFLGSINSHKQQHQPPRIRLAVVTAIGSTNDNWADPLPSTNNEDKIFNPCILIQEKPVEIITRVFQDKKLAISNASLVLEDFDPPFYEPLFFKEVPKSMMLLPFSSENEEKVFKPGIYTSEKYSWKCEDSRQRILYSSLSFLSFNWESCIQI